jgi:ABC-type transporter Mla subunit MlaD
MQGNPAFEVRDGPKSLTGRISEAFKTFLDQMAGQIEAQEAQQDTILTTLNATVATLETTVEAVETLGTDTATVAGQVSALAGYLEPLVLSNRDRLDDIEARLLAAGIP